MQCIRSRKGYFDLSKKLAIGIASVLLCGAGFAVYVLTKSDAQGVPGLIAERDVTTSLPVRNLEFAKQHKLVRLEQTTLTGIVRDSDSLTLRLFQGETLELKITSRQKLDETTAIAYGKVKGMPASNVTLSVVEDSMVGSIFMGDGRTFRIDPVGDGVHKLVEVNENTGEVCEQPQGAAGEFIAPNGEKIRVMYQRLSTLGYGTSNIPSPNNLSPSQQGSSNNGGYSVARNVRISMRWPVGYTPPTPTTGGTSTGGTTTTTGGATTGGTTTGGGSTTTGGTTTGGGSTSVGTTTGGATTGGTTTGGTTTGGTTNGGTTTGGTTTGGTTTGGTTTGGTTTGGTTTTGGGTTGGSTTGGSTTGGTTTGGGSSSSTLDILVLYTDPAAQEAGSETAIKALAGAAVGHVNTALANSKVTERAKLVATEKFSYTSSGNLSADLTKIAGDAQVKSWRDQYKADLVCLLVKSNSGSTMGIGHLGTANGNAGAAFSVCKVKAVGSPIRSFAHEIGHNLGCGHAQDQGGSSGAFAYSYGWRFKGTDDKNYRTLLSYQKETTEPRIPYYSAPSVSYQGTATGTATADNAKTISAVIVKAIAYK